MYMYNAFAVLFCINSSCNLSLFDRSTVEFGNNGDHLHIERVQKTPPDRQKCLNCNSRRYLENGHAAFGGLTCGQSNPESPPAVLTD